MWLENLLVYPTWKIPRGNWEPDGWEFEEVGFDSADGTRLHGWFFEHTDPCAHVLYCHGNREDVAGLGDYVDRLRREFRIAILVFDYRGYGKSAGRPTEPGIVADGHAAQCWLALRAGIDTTRVVLWGRSIGGAVAVQLAAKNNARALVLERTFTTMPDAAAHLFPWLPVQRLMRNRFDSLASIGAFQGPLLQSHGTTDEVVPFRLGKRLFDAASAEPKCFIPLSDVSHNGPSGDEYYNGLHRFFAEMR